MRRPRFLLVRLLAKPSTAGPDPTMVAGTGHQDVWLKSFLMIVRPSKTAGVPSTQVTTKT